MRELAVNSLSIAVESGSIVLREGFEALLVLLPLAAVLRCVAVSDELKALYIAVAFALLACFEAAFIFDIVPDNASAARVDAIAMMAASALMLYLSGRIALHQPKAAMRASRRECAKHVMPAATLVALMITAFLTVFHEGGEAVRSLQTLARGHGGWNAGVNAGLVAALIGLVLNCAAAQWLAARLPTRPLLFVASAFLFLMGLRLAGIAVRKLQAHGLIPNDRVFAPDWLASLGLDPSWESLAAQILIMTLAAICLLAGFARRPRGMVPAE